MDFLDPVRSGMIARGIEIEIRVEIEIGIEIGIGTGRGNETAIILLLLLLITIIIIIMSAAITIIIRTQRSGAKAVVESILLPMETIAGAFLLPVLLSHREYSI